VGVLVAPVIPVLIDSEIEDILGVCQKAGADSAGYVLLRLPLEIKELFKEWLATHYPLKAEHVMSLIRQSRGGKEYDSTFGKRMRGTGIFADMIAQRFATACRRLGLNRRSKPLDASGFKPSRLSGQLGLFD
jgi:DNA repair photolyase